MPTEGIHKKTLFLWTRFLSILSALLASLPHINYLSHPRQPSHLCNSNPTIHIFIKTSFNKHHKIHTYNSHIINNFAILNVIFKFLFIEPFPWEISMCKLIKYDSHWPNINFLWIHIWCEGLWWRINWCTFSWYLWVTN